MVNAGELGQLVVHINTLYPGAHRKVDKLFDEITSLPFPYEGANPETKSILKINDTIVDLFGADTRTGNPNYMQMTKYLDDVYNYTTQDVAVSSIPYDLRNANLSLLVKPTLLGEKLDIGFIATYGSNCTSPVEFGFLIPHRSRPHGHAILLNNSYEQGGLAGLEAIRELIISGVEYGQSHGPVEDDHMV